MGRRILLVTTDQQRYDAYRCNGGEVARTPTVDALAASGVVFRRAHAQSVICMPARSTILTGQLPRTHGVFANGVPLPIDAPSVAAVLGEHGYRTALIGKAHFEPEMDAPPTFRWFENRMATEGSTGPHRGFDHLELCFHSYWGRYHYDRWLDETHPGSAAEIPFVVRAASDTGAPDIAPNAMPRDAYHTDWIAQRTISYLEGLGDADDWFVWMSFPDPHHPWNPPDRERHRVDWRDLELPASVPTSPEQAVEILARKPHHWLDVFEGRMRQSAAPHSYVPAQLTLEQLREVTALIHVENELIDEAIGRVMEHVRGRGWDADTDVIVTTDHGELQGDFGLLFKGPYHCDALMRLPLIWRPAPAAGVTPCEIDQPVGQLDVAPTMCTIAGVAIPEWMQGAPLPSRPGSGHERVITEWQSQFAREDIRMLTICRDGYVCTTYEPGPLYDGTEGELYDLATDPFQWENLWDDPGRASLRADLVADLRDHVPEPRSPRLAVEAPW